MQVTRIPQLIRNAGRFREVVGVLAKYQLSVRPTRPSIDRRLLDPWRSWMRRRRVPWVPRPESDQELWAIVGVEPIGTPQRQ